MEKKYLTPVEAADYLCIAEGTLRQWVYKRLIPYRKHGGRLLFCVKDLDDWSEDKKVEVIAHEHDNLLSSLTKEYSEIG